MSAGVSLWGIAGSTKFNAAMHAIHEFARASDCKLGGDVLLHMVEQHRALTDEQARLIASLPIKGGG